MKTKLTIVFLFVIFSVFSQQYTLPVELINTYLKSGETLEDLDMILETKLGEDSFYETTIKYSGEEDSFKLRFLTYPSFQPKLKNAIKVVLEKAIENNKISVKLKSPDDDVIKRRVPLIFANIVTYHNTEEERPMVATIHLKNNEIPIFYENNYKENGKQKNETKKLTLKNPKVEISFYGGFIEKIQLQGTVDGSQITFNNTYSIGISATKYIRQLANNSLFSDDRFSIDEINEMIEQSEQIVKSDSIQYNENDRKSLTVNVADIIRYIKKVDVNANDVSPVPQLIILDETQNQSKLYKEESSKLFEVVVYSDLLGLFEEDNPNGIVQTELHKRFNLNTKRVDTRWYHKIFILPYLSEGIGYFQSFDASFQYTKFESENEFVAPNSFIDQSNSTSEPTFFHSPLDLYQLRNYAVGGILNFVTMENQNSKLNMYLNAGFLFGRTGVRNSVEDEEGFYTNNLEIPIEYQFHILPEKRVSFMLTDRLSWFDTFDSDLNIQSIEDSMLTSGNRWINNINIELDVDVSSTGKLFFRYIFTHEWDNIENNFSRLQFGYSFYLLKSNGAKKVTSR